MQTIMRNTLMVTLATIFLFCLVMCALILAAYDVLIGRPVPAGATDILLVAITASLQIVGVHTGVSISNGVVQKTTETSIAAIKTAANPPADNKPNQ